MIHRSDAVQARCAFKDLHSIKVKSKAILGPSVPLKYAPEQPLPHERFWYIYCGHWHWLSTTTYLVTAIQAISSDFHRGMASLLITADAIEEQSSTMFPLQHLQSTHLCNHLHHTRLWTNKPLHHSFKKQPFLRIMIANQGRYNWQSQLVYVLGPCNHLAPHMEASPVRPMSTRFLHIPAGFTSAASKVAKQRWHPAKC